MQCDLGSMHLAMCDVALVWEGNGIHFQVLLDAVEKHRRGADLRAGYGP